MKSCISFLLIGLLHLARMQAQSPLEILPALAVKALPEHRISLPVLEEQAAYIVSKQGRAVIRFEFGDQVGKYEVKAMPAGQKNIVTTTGTVFENYHKYVLPNGDINVIDIGGKLFVDATIARVEWSYGSDKVGYLYFNPTQMRVYVFHRQYFDAISFLD